MRTDNVVDLRDNERELLDMLQMVRKNPSKRRSEYVERVADSFAAYSQRTINDALLQVGHLCGVETLDELIPNPEPAPVELAERTPAALYRSFREAFSAGYALAALVRELNADIAAATAAPAGMIGISDKMVRLLGVIRMQTEVCRQFSEVADN